MQNKAKPMCQKMQKRCLSKECCHSGKCIKGEQKGSRRELFEAKYSKYIIENPIPQFETDSSFQDWLASDDGKKYSLDIENIWSEVDLERPWGGKRECAGRKKTCSKKVPFNRRISENLIQILKNYSKTHNITETEALERAIKLLDRGSEEN